jgi:hypothetical protein
VSVVGDPALHWALRVSLAAMLASAAVHKLRDVTSFAATIRNYRLLPDAAATVAAVVLPTAELATAGALLARFSPHGAVAALALLALYSAAIAVNLGRGRRDIDCGCLGPGHRQPLSEWLLVRNGAAALAAAVLLAPVGARPWSWLDLASGSSCVVCFAALWSAANRLLETWPRVRFVAR